MASNDITKFVDGNGDEFNFRDPSKEAVANKVTSIRASSSATDTAYPSEKAVATALSAKANISLDNTNVSALKNLYAATDGYASHSNIAVGYGLLATIDTSSISGYSDVHAIFELYDLQSGQNRTGHRTLSVNIRNNSPTAGAGSYAYKISVVEHPPVNSQFSIVAYRTGDADLRIYSVGIGTGNYGGILCRLVSCTTFYGSGLYSLVTLSRSTASSTAPSGTEVSITVTKEAAQTDIRMIAQDVSKGANLVVNGSGRMANNYNFGSFLYIPTICCNGSAGSFGFSGSISIDEFISVDFTKQVLFTADVKNLVAQPSNCVHRIYVAEYDIDKKSVQAIHVVYGVGTLTELTQDLNPGDTVVHLADLSNSNWKPSQTYQRGFIFWNYQNSFGYTYPPETYSRNVYPSSDSNALYTNDGVDVANGTITLINEWSGPSIPAGTKVSRRNSGNTFPYPANVTASDTSWHHLSGIISGISEPGSSSRGSVFSQGVAYIKVGMYPTSLSNTDDVTGKRAVVANLAVYELQDTFGGVLPVTKGGTGKTSVTSGSYVVGNGTSAFSEKTPKAVGNNVLSSLDEGTAALSTDNAVLITGDAAAANTTTFYRRKFSYIWTWIKSKLSSDSGVNISGSSASCTGNAATATAFSSGTAKTKFDGIAEGATKVEASTTNGKIKIDGTDTTVYTHPTSSGNKHVPSGGSNGQFLGWSADGTAAWSDLPKDYTTLSPSSATIRAYKRYTIGKTNVNLSSANSVRATALIRIHVNYNDELANSQVAEGMLITMLADICFRTGSLAEMRLDIIGESRWDYSKIRPVLVSFGIIEDGITKYIIAIGLGDGTNGTTLQAFDYSYIDVMPLCSNAGWDWMNEGDDVGTYDYIAQAVRETGARLGTAVGSSKLPVYVNDKGEFTAVTASSTATELLCALPEWTATPTDSTYLVRRDTGGAASFGQVTFSTVWNYIKGKMSSDPSGVLNGRVSGFTSNIWGTGAKRISLGYANMSATDAWYNAIFLLKTGYNGTIGDGRSIALMISYCHRSTGRRVSARVLVNNGWPLSLIPGVFTLETDNNTKLVVGVGVRDSNNDFVNLQYSEFNVVVLGKEESWTDNVTSDSVNACDHWFPTAQQPDIVVVDELPSSPDSNKIYFV